MEMKAASQEMMKTMLTPPATVHAWTATPFDGARGALFALDAKLGGLVRHAREPLLAQMRLTWWHDALVALDGAPPPAEPVLEALAREVLPRGVSGAEMATMVDGWEELIAAERPDAAALARYAAGRGRLFGFVARATGGAADGEVAGAGAGWALADLAAQVDDADVAATAASMARARLEAALNDRWPRSVRALGAMARDASLAARGRGAAGSPRRAAAALRMALTGR